MNLSHFGGEEEIKTHFGISGTVPSADPDYTNWSSSILDIIASHYATHSVYSDFSNFGDIKAMPELIRNITCLHSRIQKRFLFGSDSLFKHLRYGKEGIEIVRADDPGFFRQISVENPREFLW